jgi:hypothetical protein
MIQMLHKSHHLDCLGKERGVFQMSRETIVETIKKIVGDSNLNTGIVVPGDQRWSNLGPSGDINEFLVDGEQEFNLVWSATWFNRRQGRCIWYDTNAAFGDVVGGCTAKDNPNDLIASGCECVNWKKTGRCFYGNAPSEWDVYDNEGIDNSTLGSGYSATEAYIFDDIDLLKEIDYLHYKTILAPSGNFVDYNISQYTNIRYSIDVFSVNAQSVELPIRSYGFGMWRLEVNGSVAAISDNDFSSSYKKVRFALPANQWVSLDLYYYNVDETEVNNRIEVRGDLGRKVDRFRIPAPAAAPTLTAASFGTIKNAVQLTWENGFFGSSGQTAIYVSGGSGYSEVYDNWTLIDFTSIEKTRYVHANLLDGETYDYALLHISSDGDFSSLSNKMTGSSMSFVEPDLVSMSVVASGDSFRDNSQSTGWFNSSDILQVSLRSNVPLLDYPDVWLYYQLGGGEVGSFLATPLTDNSVSDYRETLYSISLTEAAITSDNDGAAFIVASGTSKTSAEKWNVATGGMFLPYDYPNGMFTIDNRAPVDASGSDPSITLDTGQLFDGSGNLLAVGQSITIRTDVTDDATAVRNSGMGYIRILASGDTWVDADGWSSWEPFGVNGVRAYTLPSESEINTWNGEAPEDYSVYVYCQFRDRALNESVPVFDEVVIDTTAPAAPTGLYGNVNGGVNVMELKWTANTEPDLKYYNVYGSATNRETPALLIANADSGYPKIANSPFFVDVVPGDTEMFYAVTAVDHSMNESDAAEVASGTTIDTVSPSAPSWADPPLQSWSLVDPDTFAQTSYLRGDWAQPTAEADLAGFYFEYRATIESGWNRIATDEDKMYAIVDVTPGLYYEARVRAIDDLQNVSLPTTTETILAAGDVTPPGAVTFHTLTGSTSVTREGFVVSQLTAQWDPPVDTDINQYWAEIMVSGVSAPGGWSRHVIPHINNETTHETVFSGLNSEVWYNVRVAAVDNVGNVGEYTYGSAQGGRDLTPPSAPDGVSIDAAFDALVVSWSANTERDLFDYLVLRSSSSSDPFVASGFALSVSQGDTTISVDLDTSPSAGSMIVVIEPYDAEDQDVIKTSSVSETEVVLETPVKVAHDEKVPVRVYNIYSVTQNTQFRDETSVSCYYNVCARDSSGNISSFALAEDSWVNAVPSSVPDAEIPFDFIAQSSTINLVKNSGFEIPNGDADAHTDYLKFWDEDFGKVDTEYLGNLAYEGTHVLLLSGVGRAESYSMRVTPDKPMQISFYCSRPWGSSSQIDVSVRFGAFDSPFSYIDFPDEDDAHHNWVMTTSSIGDINDSSSRWVRFYDPLASGGKFVPTGAYYAKIRLSSSDGDAVYVDGLQFQGGRFVTQYSPYSDEFVLGYANVSETEITDDSISTSKLQADAVTAPKILAGSIGAYHLTILNRPIEFDFQLKPNFDGTEYDSSKIYWDSGNVVTVSGHAPEGQIADSVWISQSVAGSGAGGVELTTDPSKVYYCVVTLATRATVLGDTGVYKYEPVDGESATISIEDNIENTIDMSNKNKFLFGIITTDPTGDMEFRSIGGAGSLISGDAIETGSLIARTISAGAITTEKLDANAVTAEKLDVSTAFADQIISIINANATQNISADHVEGIGDQDPPSMASLVFSSEDNEDGSVTLSWSGVTDDSDMGGYKIWVYTGVGTPANADDAEFVADLGPSVSSYTHNVGAGNFTYYLSAYDIYKNESDKAILNDGSFPYVEVTDTEGPTTIPTDSSGLGRPGGIVISWEFSGGVFWPADEDVDHVVIEYSSNSGSSWTEIGTSKGNKFIHFIDNLSSTQLNSSTYQWKMSTVDKVGNKSLTGEALLGSSVDWSDYTPSDGSAPEPPSGAAIANDGDGGVVLSWTESSSIDVEGYIINITRTNNGAGPISGAEWEQFLFSPSSEAGGETVYYNVRSLLPKFGLPINPDNDIYYRFKISAYDWQGNQSSEVTVASSHYVVDTSGPASQVSNLAVEQEGFGARLTWENPEGSAYTKILIRRGVDDSTYPSWPPTAADEVIVVRNDAQNPTLGMYLDTNLERFDHETDTYHAYRLYAVDEYDNRQSSDSGNNINISSDWVSPGDVQGWGASDKTYIKGSMIATSSITADKIEVYQRAFDTNVVVTIPADAQAAYFVTLTDNDPFLILHGEDSERSIAGVVNSPSTGVMNITADEHNYIYLDMDRAESGLTDSWVSVSETDHKIYTTTGAPEDYLYWGMIDATTSNYQIVLRRSQGTTIDSSSITTGTIVADRIETKGGKNLLIDPSFETEGLVGRQLFCAWFGVDDRGYIANLVENSSYARFGDFIYPMASEGVLVWYTPRTIQQTIHPDGKLDYETSVTEENLSAIEAGEKYCFSLYCRINNEVLQKTNVGMYVKWLDSSKEMLEVDYGSFEPEGESYQQYSFVFTAPEDAVGATVLVSGYAGLASSFAYVDGIQFEKSSVPSDFYHGGKVVIDGGNIKAQSIDTDQLSADAITAEKIAAETITSDEIAAGSLNVDRLTFGNQINVLNEYHSTFESLAPGHLISSYTEVEGDPVASADLSVVEDDEVGYDKEIKSVTGKKSLLVEINHTSNATFGDLHISLARKSDGTWNHDFLRDHTDINLPYDGNELTMILSCYIMPLTQDWGNQDTEDNAGVLLSLLSVSEAGAYETNSICISDLLKSDNSWAVGKWHRVSGVLSIPETHRKATLRIFYDGNYYGNGGTKDLGIDVSFRLDGIMLEKVDASATVPSKFAPPIPSYWDGNVLRTGYVDAGKVKIRNDESAVGPVLIGNFDEDEGASSDGLFILGEWENQTTNNISAIEDGLGLLVAHENSYTILDNTGLNIYSVDGESVSKYSTWTYNRSLGLHTYYDFNEFDLWGTTGSVWDNKVSVTWVPSGGAHAGWEGPDNPDYIEAPRFILDALDNMTPEERMACVNITPGTSCIYTGTSDIDTPGPRYVKAINSGVTNNGQHMPIRVGTFDYGLKMDWLYFDGENSSYERVENLGFRLKITSFSSYFDATNIQDYSGFGGANPSASYYWAGQTLRGWGFCGGVTSIGISISI